MIRSRLSNWLRRPAPIQVSIAGETVTLYRDAGEHWHGRLGSGAQLDVCSERVGWTAHLDGHLIDYAQSRDEALAAICAAVVPRAPGTPTGGTELDEMKPALDSAMPAVRGRLYSNRMEIVDDDYKNRSLFYACA